MDNVKTKILCFVDYYLPGFRGGGPIRTLENMVAILSDEFEFWIVTRDRDLGGIKPYPAVCIDDWNVVGQARVFYASPSTFSLRGILGLLQSIPFDVLYLNSFFSQKTTVFPLLARYFGWCRQTPVVLAPRGEFSPGALALKKSKKRLYLALVKRVGVYDDVVWHASSEFEANDILREMCCDTRIRDKVISACNVLVGPDLVATASDGARGGGSVLVDGRLQPDAGRIPGPLRLIFLSRISPKKNLDYLLRALTKVRMPVELSIYGPDEDASYWARCQDLIRSLPDHVTAIYHGEVDYQDVARTFAMHDLFVFPTRGENFGHVIYEAMSVGTAVLVSDQTPWQADSRGALQVLALERPDAWADAINQWAAFDDRALSVFRAAATQYAADYFSKSNAVRLNRLVFRNALVGY